MERQIESIIQQNNIERFGSLNKAILYVHLFLLFTSDLLNYTNNIWEVFPSQYYVFLNHVVSIPFLLWMLWLGKGFLAGKKNVPSYKALMFANVAVFLPFILVYYYWDVKDYESSGIYLIYIFVYGFTLRLRKKGQAIVTAYFAATYYGMLAFLGVSYGENPSLYLNGFAALCLYWMISTKIYELEYASVRNKVEATNKNQELLLLNEALSKSNMHNEKLINELNVSNQNLKNFALVAAHDIKAPIRTISGFAKILSKEYDHVLKQEHKECFRFIIQSSNQLSDMVESMLTFSSLTQNLPPKELFDLNELIEFIFHQLASSRTDKKVVLRIPEPLPALHSYKPLFQQLFLNLLNNSIKFSGNSRENTITITWEKPHPNFYKFIISDTGMGIPEKVKPHVFNLFQKHHSSSNQSGIGIGLATCKKIATFLNGNIEIESKVGKGTSVIVTAMIPANEKRTLATTAKAP